MTPTTLKTKVREFLAQKRIAVVGASRNNCGHLAANLFYHRRDESVRSTRFRVGLALNRRWEQSATRELSSLITRRAGMARATSIFAITSPPTTFILFPHPRATQRSDGLLVAGK